MTASLRMTFLLFAEPPQNEPARSGAVATRHAYNTREPHLKENGRAP